MLYKRRMNQILLIGIGGGVGAMLRFLMVSGVAKLPVGDFPFAILSANILGSFLMGVLAGAGAEHWPQLTPEMRAFIGVGLLGGFTTFSAFSLDLVTMVQRNEMVPAFIYMVSSVTLSVIALAIGMSLMRNA
jgi:CrcB protein